MMSSLHWQDKSESWKATVRTRTYDTAAASSRISNLHRSAEVPAELGRSQELKDGESRRNATRQRRRWWTVFWPVKVICYIQFMNFSTADLDVHR